MTRRNIMIGKINNTYYFRASYYDQLTGKRVRKHEGGFKTKKEAQLKEQEYLRNAVETPVVDLYLKDIAYDYFAHRKPYIQITSYDNNVRIFDTYILPHFTRKKIHKISKIDCRRFVDSLAKIDRSIKTKNDIITVFKSIFNHAEEYYDLKSNPARIIKRLPQDSSEKFTGDVWTVEEFKSFISDFNLNDKEQYKWATFYTLAFWTGARRGEILGLQFKDINFANRSISITKSVTQKRAGKGPVLKKPKTTSSIRTISIDDETFAMLEKIYLDKHRDPGFKNDQFIFSRDYNPYIPFADTTVENTKNRIIKKKNIKQIRFHDFRHSHASILIASGVDIVVVSARLGHSSTDLTYNIYVHLLPSAERRALDTINKIR
ncbi:MAG TPA: hypothetical protein DEA51_06535 [Erysipelotrichaceae bacterium]|nr:hypothetical protein [Erysipelotrichaceae bacterium]